MADPEDTYHWFRLDSLITTSGQPTEAQLAELANQGIRHIINLAPHSHQTALKGEAEIVQALGMSYVNIPVDFEAPSQIHFDEFCVLMKQYADSFVHIHCGANYRVAAFLYRYRRDIIGIPDDDARSDLEKVWHPNPNWSVFINGLT